MLYFITGVPQSSYIGSFIIHYLHLIMHADKTTFSIIIDILIRNIGNSLK